MLSLIEQVRHTYRPRTRLWCPDEQGKGWRTVPVGPGLFAAPGIVAYRFEANLFYANANRFSEEVLSLISQPGTSVRGLVVDASGIDDIDYSAGKALQELGRDLAGRGITSAVVTASSALIQELRQFGVGVGIGSVGTFPTLKKAVHALEQQLPATAGGG
jgi:MFS superfamily sulfate permease-like transporter